MCVCVCVCEYCWLKCDTIHHIREAGQSAWCVLYCDSSLMDDYALINIQRFSNCDRICDNLAGTFHIFLNAQTSKMHSMH